MLCIRVRFPLGVYYALTDRERPGPPVEWAPSPVRLIGALLAAAHEIPSDDVEADRAVLQRLCAAPPPIVHAPRALPCDEQASLPAPSTVVAELRGASRWAPRNPGASELKTMSPRALGMSRTEVDKGGVAIGDRPIAFTWQEIDLDEDERGRLRRLAADVAWLGTSRSPAILQIDDVVDLGGFAGTTPQWRPLPYDTVFFESQVRVPEATLLDTFDSAYAARRSPKGRVERSGQQRPAAAGSLWPYAIETPAMAYEPQHWGDFAVVVLDEASELTPRAPGTYLLARAFRGALMDAFEDRGDDSDAPGVVHGHGDAPHMAIVPLPFVGPQHADGAVRGLALVFPHEKRLPDVRQQSRKVEEALRQFFPRAESRRPIRVSGAGSVYVRPPQPGRDRQWTLSPARYLGPSKIWVTATPVVHSRWRKGEGVQALSAQIAADCAHVGLPEPSAVDLLRGPGAIGGAARLSPSVNRLPEAWRKSLQGPRSHIRLEFDRPVAGPVLLGRARHFGIGLCVPDEGAAE